MRDSINAQCRLCRREKMKLFLKGERCFSPKCPLDRKGAVSPGARTSQRHRSRVSEYGIQLREKQKLKRLYGLREAQFKHYLEKAKKVREATGEVLFQLLESRLDNLVYRLGFAPARSTARQLVSHGHVTVDGKRVSFPFYQVKEGEVISLSPKSLEIPMVKEALAKKESLPEWLERKAVAGRMKRLPKRDEIEVNVDEQAVVEYYSR